MLARTYWNLPLSQHGLVAIGTSMVMVVLWGCETPPSPEADSAADHACSGDLVLIETLPISADESLTTTLEIESAGEYCVGLVSLTGDHLIGANVEIDAVSVVSTAEVDRAEQAWIARAHYLEAGQHEFVASATSEDSGPVAIAVFQGVAVGEIIEVGAEGGHFEVGEVIVAVPPGAVSERTKITVRVLEPEPDDRALGPIVSLAPSGLELNAPLSVTAKLDPRRFVPDRSLAEVEGWLSYVSVPTEINYEQWTVTSQIESLSMLLWTYSIRQPAAHSKSTMDSGGVMQYDFSSHRNPFVVFRADLTNPYLRVELLPSELAPADQDLGIWKTRSLAEIAAVHGVLESNVVAVSASRWNDAGISPQGSHGRHLDTLFREGEQIALNVNAPEVHEVFTLQPDGPTERVVGHSSNYVSQAWEGSELAMAYEESSATVLGSSQHVLLDGVVTANADVMGAVPAARTVIGLSEDGDHLFLLVVGGSNLDDALSETLAEQGLTDLPDEAAEFFALARGLPSREAGRLLQMVGAHSAVHGGRGGSVLIGDESATESLGSNDQPALSLLAITREAPSYQGIVLDDHDSGFSSVGSSHYFGSSTGFGAGSLSMHNTDAHIEGACAWTSNVAPGNYDVHAFVPHAGGTTKSARYRVRHAEMTSCATVSQFDARGGWVHLGTYAFDDTATVMLDSRTDEAGYTEMISCDAVWLAPTEAPASSNSCDDVVVSVDAKNIVVSIEDEGSEFSRSCDDASMPWGEWEDDKRHYLWMFTDSVDNCVARYEPELTARSTYNVGLKYWSYCDQSTHVPVYVRHDGGTTGPIWIDQLVDGKIWDERIIRVGTYTMSPGMGHGFEIRNGTGEPFQSPTTSACQICGGEPWLNINVDRAVFAPVGSFDGTVDIGSPFRSMESHVVVHGFGDTAHRGVPHLGVDLTCGDPEACDHERPVFAVGNGIVTHVSNEDAVMPDWGGAVIIRMERPADNPFMLPDGGQTTTVWWLSAHLDPDRLKVSPGDAVTAGQIIGYVGPEVLGATGSYLHVEVSSVDYGDSLGAGYSWNTGGRHDPVAFAAMNQ